MTRDLSLVLLAGFMAFIYIAAIVAMALMDVVDGAAAVGSLAPLGPLAGFALGRMTGVSGERDPQPLPQRTRGDA